MSRCAVVAARSDTRDDRQHQRRSARREANRAEILDAAELVFGRDGLHNGSMRAIAAESGFSTAAIYLFFENRQELVSETITRRGDELMALLATTVVKSADPLMALHAIVDVTLDFFTTQQNFRRMLRHMRGGLAIVGPSLSEFSSSPMEDRFSAAQKLLTEVVASGQSEGAIRPADPRAIAHLYMVLVNEYVYLNTDSSIGLAAREFHAIIDGVLSPTPE